MSLESDAENINRVCFSGPGGSPQDSWLKHGTLRAELAELISQHCVGHAAKIAEAILGRYVVTRKPLKER